MCFGNTRLITHPSPFSSVYDCVLLHPLLWISDAERKETLKHRWVPNHYNVILTFILSILSGELNTTHAVLWDNAIFRGRKSLPHACSAPSFLGGAPSVPQQALTPLFCRYFIPLNQPDSFSKKWEASGAPDGNSKLTAGGPSQELP